MMGDEEDPAEVEQPLRQVAPSYSQPEPELEEAEEKLKKSAIKEIGYRDRVQ